MRQTTSPKARQQDIIVQELNGEIIVYDLQVNRAYCLNETSAAVWQLCDGKIGVSEISRQLSGQFDSPADEDLIWLAIDQLKKHNLLENKDEIVSKFDGLSRREAIRKVGLGTMVALPVITSLIAPQAASAASVCGGSCNCSKGNTSSQFPALCETELGGNANCPKRTLCDCLVVAGMGSKGGTCQGA